MPRWSFGFDNVRRKRRKNATSYCGVGRDLVTAAALFERRRLLLIEPLEDRAMLAGIGLSTLTVDSLSDTHALTPGSSAVDTSGNISLRSAIEYLNATAASGYTINFAPSLTSSGPATIHLTLGQIEIVESMTIDGPGANALTVDQTTAGGARVFQVDASANASLSGLTLSGGSAGGATSPGNDGGGILNIGSLALMAMEVSGNSAQNDGGGIYNLGGDLLVSNSTISVNSAQAGNGGAIYNNAGTLKVLNSTIAGNSASGHGGGLDNSGTATITGGTVAGNSANVGAGIYNDSVGGVTINMANTIVAGNTLSAGGSDPDVYGSFGTTDHNLIGELGDVTTLSGNGNVIANTDDTTTLGLGLLTGNGGPTRTIALAAGSAALGAGDPAPPYPFATPATDQRGYSRVVNGKIDIGAFETQPAALNYSATTSGAYTIKRVSGEIEVFDANGQLASGSANVTGAATFTNNTGQPMTLTIDYSGGDPIPAGGLSFIGGGGDTLDVTGYSAGSDVSETFTGANSGSVQVGGGGAITYSGLTPVLLNGGTLGNLIFNLPVGADATLQDNGSGTPELVSTNSAFELTTFPIGASSITINGAGGGTITTAASFTSDFTGSLSINGAATDAVSLGALTLSDAGANLTVTGQTITVGSSISATGAVSLDATDSITQTAGTITANTLALADSTGLGISGTPLATQVGTLSAQTASGGIFISNTGNLAIGGGVIAGVSGVTATTSGDIQLTSSGGITIATAGDTVQAPGNVTIQANALGTASGNFAGINVNGVTVESTGSGNVLLEATGGNSGGNNYGVEIQGGALVTAVGNGTVTINGTGGGASGGSNYGVYVTGTNSKITSGGGNVLVTGNVAAGNSGDNNNGAQVDAGGVITAGGSGTVTVAGTAGSSPGNNNYGVHVSGANSQITSAGGNVSVTGSVAAGASGSAEDGVEVDAGGVITAGGSGTVTVGGTGGSTPGSYNFGIRVTGGSSQITSAGGAVLVGGSIALGGTGSGDVGVQVDNGGAITAGGNGTVTVNGTGGSTYGSDNYGVIVTGTNSQITSSGGSVSVIGQGGASSFQGGDVGVVVANSGVVTGGTNADVSVTGTGGSGVSGGNNGVDVSTGGMITATGTGTISIQATAGSSISGTNSGFTLDASGAQVASAGGNISVGSDEMSIADPITTGGTASGVVTIEPLTASLAIDLGGAGLGSRLALTDAELNEITAGVLRVGGGSFTGNIGVSSDINPTHIGALSLITSGAGTITQTLPTISVAGGSGGLAVQAATPVLLLAQNNIGALAANIAGAGNLFAFTSSGGFAIGNVDGVAGITTAIGGGEIVALDAGGAVTQTAGNYIATSNLLLLGTGGYTLTGSGNSVGTLAADATGGVAYTDSGDLTVGSVSVPLTALSAIGLTAGSLTLDANTITLDQDVTTLGGTQAYKSPVVVGADVTLAGTTVTFDQKVDDAADSSHTLAITGGAVFNDEVGSGKKLNSLSVSGATTFQSAADAVSTSLTQSYGAATIVPAGGTLNLAASTATFNGAVDDGAATAGTDSLTVSGGAVFNGEVGGSKKLNSLHVTQSATFALLADAVTTASTQSYDGAVTVNPTGTALNLTGSNVTFGGTVDGGVPGADSLTVDGSAVFNGVVGDSTPLASLAVSGSGTVALNAAGTASNPSIVTSGNQTFSEDVRLGGTIYLTSSAGGTIDFAGKLDSASSTPENLTIDAGGGNVRFDGAVGGTNPLGTVTIVNASTITLGSTFDAAMLNILSGTLIVNGQIAPADGDPVVLKAPAIDLTSAQVLGSSSVTFITDSLIVGGDMTGTGMLTFQPFAAAGNIDINGSGSGLSLPSATLAQLTGSFAKIIFGDLASSTGTFTVDAATSFSVPVEFDQLSGGNGKIVIDGALQATGGITINGSGDSTILNADLGLAGAPLAVHDSIVLGSPALVTLLGTSILLDTPGTISDDFADTSSLAIVGTGTVTLAGAIGATPIRSLSVVGTSIVLGGGSVVTARDQLYTGNVTLGAATTLDSTAAGTTTGGNIELTGAVDGGQTLTITAGAGNVSFDADVGAIPLTSLSITSTGVTTFDGNVTTVNAQMFNGNVALGAGADTFTSTANAAITFAGSVTGAANDLTVASAGTTTFGGNVAVKGLAATSTSGITAFGPAVTSVSSIDGQAYSGAVTLGAGGTTFVSNAGGALTFGGAVTGAANNLTVSSDGTTTFDASVSVKSLTATSTSGTTSLNAGVTTTGTQTYDGLVKLLANVNLIGSTVTFATLDGNGQSLLVTGNAVFDNTVSGATALSVSDTTAINAAGITTTTLGQTYGGTVTLGANTTLTAPSGFPVAFNASVVGANHSLAVNGDADFGSLAADSVTGLTTLDVTGATTINAGNINTTGTQTYTGGVTLGNNTNLAGSTVAFMDTLSGAASLLVSGNATFDGAVTGLTALEVTGATSINTATITTSGTQHYDGATTLGAAATLTTTNSAVTFGGTLDGNDALTIAAGTGDVTFVGNVGAATPLGDVAIASAHNLTAKGSFQAASLTQSSAGTGTTELDGAVTLSGTAGLVLDAAGINLKGPTITATNAAVSPVSLSGPVTLLGNLIIDTSTGGGAVIFNDTLDSAANKGYGLTVNAGTGNVSFQQAIGAAANGAPGAIAVNSGGTTLFNQTARAASLTTDPAGSTQLGGNVTTSGTQTYGDAVTLLTGVDLQGSIVTFANTLTGGGNSLQVTGNAVFAGTITGVSTLGVSGTAAINTAAITTTNTQTYGGTVTLGAGATLTGTTVNFNAPVVGANHSLEVNGDAVFGSVATDTVTGVTTLLVTGSTTINTNNISSSGTQTYSGNVTLGTGANLAGSTVTFSDQLIGGGNSLLVTGSAVFADAEAGTVTGLTTLEVTGAATIDTAASKTTGIATSGAQSFDGNVTLTGTGTVALTTTASPVTFGGKLDGPASLTIAAGAGAITFDGNVGATTPLGDVTIASVGDLTARGSFRAASLTQSAAGTGTTELDGTVTVSGAAGLSLDAAGISLQGPTITATSATAAPVSFTGPVTLLGNLSVDTSAGGGAVNFDGAVNSAAGFAYGLTVNAAVGDVSFQQAVGNVAGEAPGAVVINSGGLTLFGGTVQAASVATDAAGSTQIDGDITTTGAQTYSDAVTLATGATTLASTAGAALTFGGTVTGIANDLTVSSNGLSTFNGNVSVKSLTATSTSGTTAFGPAVASVSSVDAQTYNDAVTLGAGATTFVSTGNAALTFDGTVTGIGNNLTVTSDGGTTFNGNFSVKSLTATSTIGATAFGSAVASASSVNAQTYNAAVTLSTGGTTFVTTGNADLTFGGTITGTGNDLSVSSNGTSHLNGNVSVKSLTTTSTTGTTAFGAAVASVSSANAQTYNDAVTFAAAATTLASTGGGDVTFNGAVNGPVALAVDTLGNEIFNTPVGAVTALASLTTDGSGPIGVGGQVRFNAAASALTPSVTTTGAQTYNDAAQLGADTLLATTANGSITFAGTLDSDAVMPRNLTLSAGIGDITFEQSVGAIHPLNNIVIQSAGAVVFDGTLSVASLTQLAGASFTFDNNVTVTGPAGVSVTAATTIDVQGITIATTAPAAPVSLQGPVLLTGNATITTAGGNVTFGGTLDSAANLGNTDSAFYGLTVNAAAGNVTFQGALGSATHGTLGAVAINSAGTTRFNSPVSAASLTTDTFGLTQLNGNVTTTGAQTYNDPVEVDAAALVLSTTNSPVSFASTINSAASMSNALTTNAGSGAITFQGAAGGGTNGVLGAVTANSTSTTRFNSTVNAASLTTDAGGLSQLNGNIATTGAQTFNDAVEVDAAALVLSTSNNPIFFAKAVNSAANKAYALTVNAGSGDVTFQQAVGGGTNGTLGALAVNSGGTTLFNSTVNAASIATDAAGQTQLNGNVTTGGSQNYLDLVSLLSGVTLDSSAGDGNITFGGTLDGGQTLDLTAGAGNVVFAGAVGSAAPLGDMTIHTAKNVTAQNTLKAASLTQAAGSGATEFDAAVAVTGASGLALTTSAVKLKGPAITAGAGPVAFSAAVTLVGNLAIDTTGGGGDVTFGQTLDGTFSLTVTAGQDLLFDGNVGGNSPLGAILVNTAHNLTASAAITADSLTQLAGSGITAFNGNVTASGATGVAITANAIDLQTITVETTAAAAPVNLQGPVALSGHARVNTAAGGGNVTFGGTLDANFTLGLAAGSGDVTFVGAVGGATPLSDVTVTSAHNVTAKDIFKAASLAQLAGTGATELDGAVTVSDATGLSLTTAAVKLKGPAITASAGPVNFAAPVTLIGNLSIDTSTGNTAMTFGQTLDGTENLSLKAGTGNIVFVGTVGGTTPLGDVTITSAKNVTAQSSLAAGSLTQLAGSGTTELDGAATLSDATGLALTANAIWLKGPTITASAGPAVLNGPVTLIGNLSIDTLAGGGAIAFGNTLDGGQALSLKAGAGNITFVGAVGFATPLGDVAITSAKNVTAGRTFSAGSLTQLAGSGTTELDAAVAVSDATGLSLTTNAVKLKGPSITATSATPAAVNFSAPVTLIGNLAIDTSAGGGPITFGTTLDGGQTLELAAGTGNILFAGAVGGGAPLSDVTIGSANNVTAKSGFSAASLAQLAGGGTSEFDAAVTVSDATGLVVTTGAVKLNGPTITAAAASPAPVTFNAPVTLIGNTAIDTSAGNGDISFNGTLNGNPTLGLKAGSGSILFAGAVGGGTPLGDATITSAKNVTAQSSFSAASLTQLAGSGTTELDGAVTVSDATGLVLTTSAVSLKGPTVTATAASAAPVTLSAPITLTGDVVIDTSAAGGAATFNGTLNSAANKAYALTINAGSGDVTFQQAVGGGTNGTFGALAVNSGGTTLFNNTVNAASVATDAAGQTQLNGNITTSGGQTYGDKVTLSAAAATLASTGAGKISFAQTLDGGSALTLNTTDATVFQGAVGGGTPLASLTTDSLGTTAINGGAVTTSGAQSYGDNVTLGAAATTAASTGGGNISFAQTLDGASALTINTAGATLFNGAVGGTTPLVTILTDSPGSTAINGGAVTTRGAQTFNDIVALGAAATTLTSTAAGNITFAQTLNGASALTVNTAGTTAFNGAVGATAALTSIATDPAGATTINGGLVSTTAAQNYGDSVTLGTATTTLASTGGGNIIFAQTLDGGSALSINTAGATVFSGAVGGATPLVSIATDSPGTTAINGGSVTTSGPQNYGDKVMLGAAATTLASNGGGDIRFVQTLDGAATLTINTAGATVFGGAVGGSTPLTSIVTDSPGTTAVNGGAVTTSGAQSYGDKVTLGAAATTLTSTGGGNVSFAQTLDGASALTINTAGATIFNGAVGHSTPLASLATDAPGGTAVNGGAVTTSGSQTYNDNASLGADTAFAATAGGITFNGSLNSDASAARNAAISAAGNVAFGDGNGSDAVGGVHPLATLTVSGNTTFDVAASTSLSPAVITNGTQTYNGPVTLAADTALATLNSGNVVFNSTIDAASDGGQALTIDTTGGRIAGAFGVTRFNADLGGSAALKSLTLTTGGAFNVNNSVTIKTTGDIHVVVAENNPGVAGDDINVQTGGAVLSSTGNVLFRAGDNITIAGNVAAKGNIVVQGDYNNNDPSPGTTINVSGALQAAAVSILGGNGNDTINLTGAIQAATVTVDNGAGNDTVNVQKTVSGTTTTINAGPGSDAISISSSAPSAGGTLANIVGQVVVNGGAGDVLNVYDNGDANSAATGDLTGASLTGYGMGAGIVYQGGLKTVNLRLGSGADLALNVHSTAATTPVYVVGQNAGTVNVGDNNQIASIAGTLDVTGLQTLNLNDQNSDRGQTYNITNEAVARPGTPLQVLVLYHKVGTVEVNAGNQIGGQLVDDTFNLFLPAATDLPLSATLKFDGGTSPGGYHNTLNVVASQSSAPTGFIYRAHVGLFGSQDPIQVQNIQVLHMYGSPVDSNDFANEANVSSVIIGGINADTLVGGLGQDVIFGGGDTAKAGDSLIGGGGGNLDFIFAEFRPQFNADGSVSFVKFSGSGNTIINAGGGAAVSLTPDTNINNASSVIQVNGRIDVVTWLTARFASPTSVGSIFQQALSTDPVLSGLQAPPAGPAPVPVASLTPGPTIAALTQFINDAYEDLLGRAADPSSLDAAVNALANGLSRGSFVYGLTHSAEYYAVNVVIPAYKNYLNRAPEEAGLAFWIKQLQGGLTDEQLEAGFISSDEFYAAQGHGTDSGWIDALYTKLLCRSADSADKTYWLAQLAAGESRMQVALDFATSLEREAQRVTSDYQYYLHRSPEQAGINYWVQQFANGMTNEDLVTGFVSSDEYFADH